MPSQILPDVGGDAANNEIKVKTFYNTEIMISYIQENIIYEELCDEIRKNCRFAVDQPFTIKWIDEENDPCTLSTQMELDEAIRLHELNHNPELVIHEFNLSNRWQQMLQTNNSRCFSDKYFVNFGLLNEHKILTDFGNFNVCGYLVLGD
uniref:PB1 domain-containing protein n=1 Tax=Glossina brevipalpis TaxID=37001 RepID=A0A1A9WV53_9MUSC